MDLHQRAMSLEFLRRDHDTKFVTGFGVFTSMGLRILRSPLRAP